jgi:hypothetical protein
MVTTATHFIFDADHPREALAPASASNFPKGIRFSKFWHFEDPACWSRAPAASLVVDRLMFPVPHDLLVEVIVFNATKDRPKTITVTSHNNVPRRYVCCTSGRRRMIVKTPDFEGGSTQGEIFLHIDKLESPFQVGLSQDDRMLGLSVLAISVHDDEPTLPLDLCGAEHPPASLVTGWSTPEAHGIWTETDVAELLFERRQLANAIGVDLAYVPMNRPSAVPPVEIRFSCNGHEMKCVRPAPGAPHVTRIMFNEATLLGDDQCIRIEMNNVMSPAELGLSADERRLGLCLQRIEPVYPDDQWALET